MTDTGHAAHDAAARIQAWRNQLDADRRAWFVTYDRPIPEPLYGPDEEVPGHYGYGTGLIGPNGEELPLLLADLDAVLADLKQHAQDQEAPRCGSYAHKDFVGDQRIQCEQPKGHFWHRNGQRRWTS